MKHIIKHVLRQAHPTSMNTSPTKTFAGKLQLTSPAMGAQRRPSDRYLVCQFLMLIDSGEAQQYKCPSCLVVKVFTISDCCHWWRLVLCSWLNISNFGVYVLDDRRPPDFTKITRANASISATLFFSQSTASRPGRALRALAGWAALHGGRVPPLQRRLEQCGRSERVLSVSTVG